MIDDVQRRSAAGFQYAHQHRTLAVHTYHIGLGRIAIPDMRHVMDINYRAVYAFEWNVIKVLDSSGAGI